MHVGVKACRRAQRTDSTRSGAMRRPVPETDGSTYIIMAYIAVAYIAMAYIAMACIVTAYIVMAYIVLAP